MRRIWIMLVIDRLPTRSPTARHRAGSSAISVMLVSQASDYFLAQDQNRLPSPLGPSGFVSRARPKSNGSTSLFSQSEPPRQFRRPPHEIVRTVSVGQMRHVLDQGGSCEMVLVGDVLVSPKRREPTYRLSNGETVVVTSRAQVELPAGIDGVLRELGDRRFKWLRHRRLKALEDAFAREGWAGAARKQARAWSGQFRFRAEEVQSQGLRPPQVGALHAVGDLCRHISGRDKASCDGPPSD